MPSTIPPLSLRNCLMLHSTKSIPSTTSLQIFIFTNSSINHLLSKFYLNKIPSIVPSTFSLQILISHQQSHNNLLPNLLHHFSLLSYQTWKLKSTKVKFPLRNYFSLPTTTSKHPIMLSCQILVFELLLFSY